MVNKRNFDSGELVQPTFILIVHSLTHYRGAKVDKMFVYHALMKSSRKIT